MGQPAVSVRYDEPEFYIGDPHETYRRLRSESPVHWYEEGRFWVLSKYDDIKFSSSHPQGLLVPRRCDHVGPHRHRARARRWIAPACRGVMFLDPPAHGAHRKAVSVRFTPKAVSDMDGHVRKVICDILDGLPNGSFELDRGGRGAGAGARVLRTPRPPDERTGPRCLRGRRRSQRSAPGNRPTKTCGSSRRRSGRTSGNRWSSSVENPTDDILTMLTTAEVDGKPFDEVQVITYATTLLAAGSETTQSLIAGMASVLIDRPEDLERIRVDPALSAGAVEELLRWWTPVTSMAREAVQDVTLHGNTIHKGDGVLLLYPLRTATRSAGARTPTPSTSPAPTHRATWASDSASTSAWARTWPAGRAGSCSRRSLAATGPSFRRASRCCARRRSSTRSTSCRSAWSAERIRTTIERPSMTLPMDGIRVLEVAQWTFVPAAGAVMADWGADVIKIEHPVSGDAQRGLRQLGAVKIEGPTNPVMEHANRGKRSMASTSAPRPASRRSTTSPARATSSSPTFLPSTRQRLGIDVEHIRAVNPSIVYGRADRPTARRAMKAAPAATT